MRSGWSPWVILRCPTFSSTRRRKAALVSYPSSSMMWRSSRKSLTRRSPCAATMTQEFHSLLGLLGSDFETLDLPRSTQTQRRELARFFVQRKRADVEKWMGEDTPFPEREAFEWPYDLSKGYARFFDEILDFARKLIAPDPARGGQQRVQYWTALALLRGVMSSPAAGIEMLNTRLSNLASAVGDDTATATEGDGESEENP